MRKGHRGMALNVFHSKNQANRKYENDFFAEFASNLSALFDKKNYTGVLLGHPVTPEDDHFQPDALLITESAIIIIDFKEFEQHHTIELPSAEKFETGQWKTRSGIIVKGGYSANPFEQLKKKRERLRDLLGHNATNISLQCTVLFAQEVSFNGTIPGKYKSWFSVTNKFDYLRALENSFNLTASRPFSINAFVERFDVVEFEELVPMTLGDYKRLAEVNEATHRAEEKLLQATLMEQQAETKKAEAERLGVGYQQAAKELEKAQELAENSRKEAEQLRLEFEGKKDVVETAWAKALAAEANADIARQETEREKIKAESEEKQRTARQKNKNFFVTLGVLITLVLGGFFIFNSIQQSDKLHADRLAGRVCIPVDEVQKYEGEKGVCVVFRINHVGESNNFTFLNDKSFGTFTALIRDKEILPIETARADYLYQEVEVRGNITMYQDTYQIEVRDLEQVKFTAVSR